MLAKLKQKVKERLGVPFQNWSLHKIKENGFSPKVIYDIGAYSGMWTKEMLSIFPEASFYMFEGQDAKVGDLQSISKQYPQKVNFYIGNLGPEDEKAVVFNENEIRHSVQIKD